MLPFVWITYTQFLWLFHSVPICREPGLAFPYSIQIPFYLNHTESKRWVRSVPLIPSTTASNKFIWQYSKVSDIPVENADRNHLSWLSGLSHAEVHCRGSGTSKKSHVRQRTTGEEYVFLQVLERLQSTCYLTINVMTSDRRRPIAFDIHSALQIHLGRSEL